MRLTDIRVYPIKSAAGFQRESALVYPWGLDGDRRWAVIGEDGENLWLGEFPRMVSVTARGLDDGGLGLAAPGLPGLRVSPATGRAVPVGFSGLDRAVLADDAAHAWFTELLGCPARLVWLDDPRRRSISARHGGLPGEVVSFAWDAPLLLTSEASLRRLDDWIAETAMERQEETPRPLSVARFRPNVVIGGAEPYEEDGWTEVRIGEVDFRVSERCDRCAVTTIDPETQVKGKEPLRTLARHRRWDGKTWFGVRLVPKSAVPNDAVAPEDGNPGAGAMIRVGDPVTPLR
ncbi:molybdenum cofactor biosysynthesis protein [Planotetraspora thailandica]|uniref:Molybdenum cofactor biosysynthesis protein n=1 Tax=Planotetraspora thailandica TaxID=487172 RepID=A0A8J3UZB7_9ACTN|nr:MOSC N-terminal beta barrel domain-containing protein [Planotetraspora thailandica]GII54628.1 molybdenum cofactor biosysynthesis protein [Planotetraspora thailandica]